MFFPSYPIQSRLSPSRFLQRSVRVPPHAVLPPQLPPSPSSVSLAFLHFCSFARDLPISSEFLPQLNVLCIQFVSCDSSSFFQVIRNINNGDIIVIIGTSVCSFVHAKCRPIQLPSPAQSHISIFTEKPVAIVTVIQMR